uniref:Uncharacterized protein n=1 Tax=Pseudomonas aeruginosa TaxID=287 RepID=A0A5P9WB41_PSEAI|nr:hypothetical protein pNK546KPC_0465 [Pseudomonas aeruginosa]UVD63422.1 hypothetical protein LMJLGFJF_00442 [Pseudomonas aeruginosa]
MRITALDRLTNPTRRRGIICPLRSALITSRFLRAEVLYGNQALNREALYHE